MLDNWIPICYYIYKRIAVDIKSHSINKITNDNWRFGLSIDGTIRDRKEMENGK